MRRGYLTLLPIGLPPATSFIPIPMMVSSLRLDHVISLTQSPAFGWTGYLFFLWGEPT
jgi:hypothetical protein